MASTSMSPTGEDFSDDLNLQNFDDTTRDDDWLPVSTTCSIDLEDDVEMPWVQPQFQNTNPIIAAHTKMWRGGHTNDVTSLILGTKEEANSYIVGLLVSSITILVFFLAWMILLITLKGCGRNRVGFLSGKRAKLPLKPIESPMSNPDSAPGEGFVAAAPLRIPEKDKEGNNRSSTNNIELDLPPLSSEHEQEQKETKQSALLPNDEWNELYATKKKEERWMKGVVLFACTIVICMVGVMAREGVQSLKVSLSDAQASLSYAQILLNETEDVVNGLANGLEEFQTDFLDVLEQTNTGLCPRLKPKGICSKFSRIDSCDFRAKIGLDREITIDRFGMNETIDVNYNQSIDVLEPSVGIKDKIGLDGTVNLRELLFPNFPQLYGKLIKTFSSEWPFIDRLYDFADTLNSVSTRASQVEQQISTFNWIFHVAFAFDVVVGLIAVCMIVHILANERLPQSFKRIQRRYLFPLFIVCVSIAFIFAIVFLIVSMALSDTCVNNPSKRILSIAKYHMGNGIGADLVLQIIKQWVSKCTSKPPSVQEYHVFIEEAQMLLEAFDVEMQNIGDNVTEFCGTIDYADLTSSSLKVLCSVIGLTLDLRKATKCSTWMPLYYNTLHNAVCYNGINGLWITAVTQLTTLLMACIILTFRAVFFDLETIKSDNNNDEDFGLVSSSGGYVQNNDENEKAILDDENEVKAN